ncbi:MAG TPA: metal ABC transporter permease [Thermomicrobiales bacterium]|nr:metal ABC transporter permease [Thermomicrobiales bacterium]
MMSPTTAILLTAVLAAAACALPGTFLVLRRMSMMTDAISHAILPGLVAGYFLAQGPNVLVGAVGATGAAILTVTAVEALQRSRYIDSGSAMGIIFPAMFALGTVLVSRWFANVHLDTDAILYGNIEFSFFDRLVIGGRDLGPQSIWIMCTLLAINLLFLGLFYKELKLTTFDPGMAAMLGFSPAVVHYALMLVLSVTTVGAFTAVGAILVVALVIVPAATAYLLTDRLIVMMGLSLAIGAAAGWSGYELAIRLDTSVSGAMVTMLGVFFLAALFFSPSQGLIAKVLRQRNNARRFAVDLLLMHLWNHETTETESSESTLGHISAALRWPPDHARAVVTRAMSRGLVRQERERLTLTDTGREYAGELV